MKSYEDENKEIASENRSLKAELLKSVKELKALKESQNDLEQYSRRDCVEIRGIPSKDKHEKTNYIVKQVGDMIGVEVREKDISVNHRLSTSKWALKGGKKTDPATIIVKFLRRDVKYKFYRASKELKNLTTKDLGYSATNKIYITESLTQENKGLFKECLQFKKNQGFKFIWTSGGRIFLRKVEDSSVCNSYNKC